uniref:Uncharacterized protein n=1 Tax=Opuntia streptacantha TaxID=393608 RepID=A0A7C9F0V3_OPUST
MLHIIDTLKSTVIMPKGIRIELRQHQGCIHDTGSKNSITNRTSLLIQPTIAPNTQIAISLTGRRRPIRTRSRRRPPTLRRSSLPEFFQSNLRCSSGRSNGGSGGEEREGANNEYSGGNCELGHDTPDSSAPLLELASSLGHVSPWPPHGGAKRRSGVGMGNEEE